jgi:hypothetical protein
VVSDALSREFTALAAEVKDIAYRGLTAHEVARTVRRMRALADSLPAHLMTTRRALVAATNRGASRYADGMDRGAAKELAQGLELVAETLAAQEGAVWSVYGRATHEPAPAEGVAP